MQVVVLTNESLKEEFKNGVESFDEEIIWCNDLSQFQEHKEADVFVDLIFRKEHLASLQQLLPKLVIINSVEETLSETNASFVRINGWPGFLQSSTIEAAALNNESKKITETVFSLFKKTIEWLPDEIGFITPRVICMIINEAFISLEENISSKEDINTAMKLGTNYPYGPFEWAEKIGVEKITSLLLRLSKSHSRYQPSSLLLQESI
jgi:3-hydroxybutyryl-CoA dehydrogenase